MSVKRFAYWVFAVVGVLPYLVCSLMLSLVADVMVDACMQVLMRLDRWSRLQLPPHDTGASK